MRFLVMLALLVTSAPAWAGLKATYTDADNQRLDIEVTDGGDIRIGGPDATQYGLIKGDQFYVVARQGDQWTVARIEDVARAFGEVVPPLVKELFGAFSKAPTKPPSLRVEEKGKQMHLGREGVILIVHDPTGRPTKPTRLLVSRDEDLRPLGRALEQFTLSFFVLMGGLTGPTTADDIQNLRSMFALGTPLDMEEGFKLIALQQADVPSERVALPAKPQTLEQIVAQINVRPLTDKEVVQPEGTSHRAQ